jgi:hypothetical protein
MSTEVQRFCSQYPQTEHVPASESEQLHVHAHHEVLERTAISNNVGTPQGNLGEKT